MNISDIISEEHLAEIINTQDYMFKYNTNLQGYNIKQSEMVTMHEAEIIICNVYSQFQQIGGSVNHSVIFGYLFGSTTSGRIKLFAQTALSVMHCWS